MKKNLLIKLRQMLLKFEDINTEEGVVLSVEGDLEVGKEVFTTDDNGDVVPAPDGDYNYENKVITVAEGVITVIADKEAPVETPAEETPAEEPVVEENEEDAPAAEETPAEDEKDAKIAELQARIAELEAENAEAEGQAGRASRQARRGRVQEPGSRRAHRAGEGRKHRKVPEEQKISR